MGEHLSLILVHTPTQVGSPPFPAWTMPAIAPLMPCLYEALEGLHGSAVMLPNGTMFARLYEQQGRRARRSRVIGVGRSGVLVAGR